MKEKKEKKPLNEKKEVQFIKASKEEQRRSHLKMMDQFKPALDDLVNR